jgi:hypothetical protein
VTWPHLFLQHADVLCVGTPKLCALHKLVNGTHAGREAAPVRHSKAALEGLGGIRGGCAQGGPSRDRKRPGKVATRKRAGREAEQRRGCASICIRFNHKVGGGGQSCAVPPTVRPSGAGEHRKEEPHCKLRRLVEVAAGRQYRGPLTRCRTAHLLPYYKCSDVVGQGAVWGEAASKREGVGGGGSKARP